MPVNPNPTKPRRHTRRRMEIRIYFRLRSSQATDLQPRPIQVRLTMDGRTIADYPSGVKVRPQKWSQTDQMMTGRTKSADEVNEQLAQVDLQHRDILRELKRRYARGEGPRPTPELIKAEFLKPGSTSPTLLELYNQYLNYLDTLAGTDDGLSEKTIERAYKTRDHLKAFDHPHSPRVSDLTTGWGKRFHIWLQTHPDSGKRRMQKDSANKYLSHVRDALNYAIDEGFISVNVLDKFRPKRGKGKPVYFLESIHVEKLMGLESHTPGLNHVLWWSRLMCLTGLDYVDAARYARNRHLYERRTKAGVKICITRSKPPKNECEIPLLPQVDILFSWFPEGPPAPILADVNRHLKVIAPAIGFHLPLTTKILRKTAGAMFLRIGYPIAMVSRILGHSSIRTSEQHYVKVTSEYVDTEMERMQQRRLESGRLGQAS